jgi:uncharacterized iron-regulated membrane protein
MLSRGSLHRSHKTLGLAVGLLLLLQALSGGALVFREALLVSLNRSLLAVGRPTAPPELGKSLGSILHAIDVRFDEPAVERVVFPRGQRTAALVYLKGGGLAGRRVIASDPASGAVLGEITGVGLLPFVLFRLHDELLLGNLGHAVLLGEGIALLYLVVVGVLLARPKWSNALRVRWRGWKLQRLYDLHRVAGLSCGALLAFSALTGAILQADFLAAGGDAPAPSRASHPDWSVLEPSVRSIEREYPPGAIEDVRIAADRRTARILVHAQDTVRPLAFDRMEVNLVTGEARPMHRAVTDPIGRSSLGWMYPLHSGKALGWVGALLALVSALGLICMPLLGWLLWRARRPVTSPAPAASSTASRAPPSRLASFARRRPK